jgi:hypothetical protein
MFDFNELPSKQMHYFEPLKARFSLADLHELITFIWSRDSYAYAHPRYRIQVAFSILLIFYLGISPNFALGTGLQYQDAKILVSRKDGDLRVLLVLTVPYEKQAAKK